MKSLTVTLLIAFAMPAYAAGTSGGLGTLGARSSTEKTHAATAPAVHGAGSGSGMMRPSGKKVVKATKKPVKTIKR